MFCLDPLHPIYNAILEAVAAQPGITMAQLHDTVRKKHKVDTSLQHLYRTVSRLIDDQILLKAQGKLSINAMWLSYLEFFADKAKRAASGATAETLSLPLDPKQRLTLRAHTLLDVQAIWNHALVQLNRLTGERFLFKYYSHAWWQLGRHALDAEFYKTIKNKGVRCYWLYGSDTPLDRHAATLHHDLYESRIATKTLFPKEGYNVNVYGEYVLECIFPDIISRQMAFFFQTVPSIDAFDAALLSDIFAMKADYKITLWRNKGQAATVRAKIAEHFV